MVDTFPSASARTPIKTRSPELTPTALQAQHGPRTRRDHTAVIQRVLLHEGTYIPHAAWRKGDLRIARRRRRVHDVPLSRIARVGIERAARSGERTSARAIVDRPEIMTLRSVRR